MRIKVSLFCGALFGLATAFAAPPAQARVTRIKIVKVEPAFGGKTFGDAGAYVRLTGIAHGEVDPKSPANAVIQDIELAPRNAHGMVEYETDIDIVCPKDPAKSNNVLLFEVINRGNKSAISRFNSEVPDSTSDINALRDPGDGWMQKLGITLVHFAWQADVLPGANRMLFRAPVAKNPDGSPVTGLVRSEITVPAPTTSVNLSTGWFTGMTHASYPTVDTDNRKALADGFLPTLTVRQRAGAPRIPIANTEWSFADCTSGTAKPDDRKLCYPAGFKPGFLYEVIYRAKDPTVLGLGYAAARDLGVFFKTAAADDTGTPNPIVHGKNVRTIIVGSSQSGRFIRSMIQLGFNEAESGARVFDGALPHIGGGLMPLNVRFGQPGRAWGNAVDHEYPAYDFPFSYTRQTDPLTGRTQGLQDRCMASQTCPRIFHAATSLEIWDGRQSLGLTDPLGRNDVADPPNVRTYIMASTQHGAAPLPLPTTAPFGVCTQQPNPNPQIWTLRALLDSLIRWVRDDKRPPDSSVPRIADGTLVTPDEVLFPAIPANDYGGVKRPAVRYLAQHNPLEVLDRGPAYKGADSSGIETIVPPEAGTASYGVLVPQVDADGNDLGGVRSLFQLVPIGTYTGWNAFRPDWFDGAPCALRGSFIPFAPAKADRAATGDPRLSLEERYPTKDAYVNAMREAADRLISQGFLLPEDANRLITDGETRGVRTGP